MLNILNLIFHKHIWIYYDTVESYLGNHLDLKFCDKCGKVEIVAVNEYYKDQR